MRRILTAAVLAAPLLLTAPGPAQAFDGGPCSYGYGCGGFCLNLFSRIHQHGPLYNYGPYYGYPPFEPYGPWNAYLQYNGADHGAAGKPEKVKHLNSHPLFNGGLGSLFHRHKCGSDKGGTTGGCSSCAGGHAVPTHTAGYNPYPGNPYAGYTGYGHNPYATLNTPYMVQPRPYQPVQPAGVPYR